ncbi:hypothetical protein AB0I60_20150 [Actinosynnema sp. NPDC050436]|uniref:hypothetical protein n=1 Tax=Actinosynnema sp. NPDC050436 TaxID=3155659 RepID=UPI0033FCA406
MKEFVRKSSMAAAIAGAVIMVVTSVPAAQAQPSDDVSIAACRSLSVSKPVRSGSEVRARVRAGACSSSTWVTSGMFRDGARFDSYSQYGDVDVYLRVPCKVGQHEYRATISANGITAAHATYITC